ncbi:hypothetical protein PR202_gb10772 [Eleusine coracana subsp. coracana]|uniref:Flavodoxin-like domain-containing protein n=1 Tax=Eleusine coracana subsp. coracana TaxID=191504 RepID=A0AAV5EKU8_ELECO|nr:hypothetical protein PR202_gb10772 [Eleusine coracana subsp. coracana]
MTFPPSHYYSSSSRPTTPGHPPPLPPFLARWLEESAADFRAGALLLSGLRFAVFGVGSRAYGETFNTAARNFSRWLRALGAVEVVPLGEGDVDGGDLEAVFEELEWEGAEGGEGGGGGRRG